MSDEKPKVGVGVFVVRDGKVLLQKRKGSHGEGTWSLPGGHLEFKENIEDCARREVMEEIGIEIKNLKVGPHTNDIFEVENKHYITIFVISEHDSGDIKITERDKCEEIGWFEEGDFPDPLFIPLKNLLGSGFSIKSFMESNE
jgi:8-oxo-dGTP diphosphatase